MNPKAVVVWVLPSIMMALHLVESFDFPWVAKPKFLQKEQGLRGKNKGGRPVIQLQPVKQLSSHAAVDTVLKQLGTMRMYERMAMEMENDGEIKETQLKVLVTFAGALDNWKKSASETDYLRPIGKQAFDAAWRPWLRHQWFWSLLAKNIDVEAERERVKMLKSQYDASNFKDVADSFQFGFTIIAKHLEERLKSQRNCTRIIQRWMKDSFARVARGVQLDYDELDKKRVHLQDPSILPLRYNENYQDPVVEALWDYVSDLSDKTLIPDDKEWQRLVASRLMAAKLMKVAIGAFSAVEDHRANMECKEGRKPRKNFVVLASEMRYFAPSPGPRRHG